MSPTNRHKYKYFHSAVQRAKDRRQKFHFCRLPFDIRPRNVKLSIIPSSFPGFNPVHTRTEEFENGGFTLKMHQMFSVHITPEEFKNASITGQFGFLFEENSVREIT